MSMGVPNGAWRAFCAVMLGSIGLIFLVLGWLVRKPIFVENRGRFAKRCSLVMKWCPCRLWPLAPDLGAVCETGGDNRLQGRTLCPGHANGLSPVPPLPCPRIIPQRQKNIELPKVRVCPTKVVRR